MNSIAERWIQTSRRELRDRTLTGNQQHRLPPSCACSNNSPAPPATPGNHEHNPAGPTEEPTPRHTTTNASAASCSSTNTLHDQQGQDFGKCTCEPIDNRRPNTRTNFWIPQTSRSIVPKRASDQKPLPSDVLAAIRLPANRGPMPHAVATARDVPPDVTWSVQTYDPGPGLFPAFREEEAEPGRAPRYHPKFQQWPS